ncbi:MAG: hypothetical protein Q7S50_00475 [bacterium]|nr:hypothetical protein [bacterium]
MKEPKLIWRPYAPKDIARPMPPQVVAKASPEKSALTTGARAPLPLPPKPAVRVEDKAAPAGQRTRSTVKAPVIRGGALLDMMAEIKRQHKLVLNLAYIARQMGMPVQLVRKLYLAGNFTPEMEALIRTEDLWLEIAFAIQQYPPALRAPIAKTFKSAGRTPRNLGRILRDAESDGMQMKTLRFRLESLGVVWPKGLNNDGTPKQV